MPVSEVWVSLDDGERYDVIAHWRDCLLRPHSEDFATRQEIKAVLDALEEAESLLDEIRPGL